MDPSPPVDDMETEFIGDGDDQDKRTSSKRSKGEENNANNNNSMETPSKFPIGDPHSNMKKEKATVAFKEHNLVQYLKENILDLKTSNAIKITRKVLNEKGALEDVDMVSFLNRSKVIYENEEYDCINYSCYICFKTFLNWQDRDKHMAVVHEKKIITDSLCDICGKQFMSKSSLNYHQDTCHSETNFEVECKVCGMVLSHNISLQRHMVIHKGSSESYKCDECGKQFARKDNLTIHKQRIHQIVGYDIDKFNTCKNKEDGNYTCPLCNSTFTKEVYLGKHMIIILFQFN